MRVKPVPAPPDGVEGLEAIREAVPLVPEPEASCCDRLASRTGIDSEDASDWLAFLRGMGLVREGESGYHRTREEPADLGAALIEGVYGAREVCEILEASEPLAAEEVFERFEGVPHWERHRDPEWGAVWRERIERLLEWLVLFEVADRQNGGYTA